MNFTRSAFARRAAVVMLAAFAAVLPQMVSAQSSPLVGTWNFIPEKSTGPARYKSMTLTFSDPAVMNVDGVDAQGKPVKGTFAAVTDGKPHPITGIPDFDSGSWTRYSDTSASYSYTKGRSIVVLGTRSVSADGKTMTMREQMIDRNGKQSAPAVLVFENPDVKVATVVAPPPAAASAAPAPAAAGTGMTADETAASAALAKGDDDEAIRLFTKVIDTNKPTPVLYFDHVSRGIAYIRKNQPEMALADFDAAVKLKPDDVDAHFRRGGVRTQLMQFQQAIEDLTTVIQADDMNAAAYRLRAFSYTKLGDEKNAAPDYEKACMINKDFCL
ncbi:MAG TPA: tetratricopeptide repeat protein [Micropepsaceae bacterium]|nr:tetratricopeptide repeat protein [Micropepsaceae bacterium]